MITFLAAISALAVVHIPRSTMTGAGRKGRGNLWHESAYGFRYIWERPSLRGMVLVPFVGNLILIFGFAVFTPMVLARTNNDQTVLGTVQSAFGVGALAGGLAMSIWGGPKHNKIWVAFGGWTLLGVVGPLLMGLGRTPLVWAIGAFLFYFFPPIILSAANAIYQSKVAPDVQGRVFGVRRMIATITESLATLFAGPLADRVFGPAMMPGGSLAATFGGLSARGQAPAWR